VGLSSATETRIRVINGKSCCGAAIRRRRHVASSNVSGSDCAWLRHRSPTIIANLSRGHLSARLIDSSDDGKRCPEKPHGRIIVLFCGATLLGIFAMFTAWLWCPRLLVEILRVHPAPSVCYHPRNVKTESQEKRETIGPLATTEAAT